jgi:Ca2+-transporting ATPase
VRLPDGQPALAELTDSQVYTALKSRAGGLRSEEVTSRLAAYGLNELPHFRRVSAWIGFGRQFTDFFALVLLGASALTLIAFLIGRDPGNLQLSAAILGVVVLNAGIGFGQEYMAERTAEALKAMVPERSKVIRDGLRMEVAAAQLVPGDVVILEAGNSVPADGRVVESHQLSVDNSALTGESRPMARRSGRVDPAHNPVDLPNLAFMGTSVVTGTGTMVVRATGLATEFGRIYRLTSSVPETQTPLQRQVATMAKRVAAAAMAIGALVLALRIGAGSPVVDAFIFALGVMVALVPEGLPATLSASLAFGVRRMARRNALVKRLLAVEALGSVTVICTDKTGTLTSAEMTVQVAWESAREHVITGSGYAPEGTVDEPDAVRSLLRAAALCSNATLIAPQATRAGWRVLGDTMEGALLVAARKAGIDVENELARAPRTWEFPFDPGRRMMTTVHQEGRSAVAYVKGAPSEVIPRSQAVLWGGNVSELDPRLSARIEEDVDRLAARGLRVLAIATKFISTPKPTQEEAERGLLLLGLVGIIDPPRQGVPEAIAACRRAGVRVVMLTGDHGLTAEAIGRQIGLLRSPQPRIVHGGELHGMSEATLRKLLEDGEDVIFARLQPEHKLRIVAALMHEGEVVAVTGDGANDAPALKRADIGVAMGRSGTDVAREASELVLLDDSFASIAAAIELGRSIYDNIRKFLTYIFSHNIAELTPILAASAVGFPHVPLTALQVLAIDLGSDVMPALALGLEPPEPGTMDRPPRSPRANLFSWGLARRFLFLGSIQAAGVVFAFFWKIHESGLSFSAIHAGNPYYVEAMTMTQAGIVVSQFFNGFAVRTERQSVFRVGLFSNWRLVAAQFFALGMIASISYAPPLQALFHTGPLSVADWALLFGFGLVLFCAEEARKLIVRRRGLVVAGAANYNP